MPLLQNLPMLKVLGVFGIIVMVVLVLGGTLVGVGKAIKTGDWSEAMKSTGGRVFSVDSTLNQETQYLLSPEHTNIYDNLFHLSYALTLLFTLFFIGLILFKIGNWLLGIKAFSPSGDILIIVLIILLLMLLQFLYTYFILHETIIPLSGIYNFVKNLPAIVNNML